MRQTLPALFAALLMLAIAGCGVGQADGGVATLAEESDGGSGDSADAGGEADDRSREEQALAFAQCMRENGVDMPDPEVGEDGGLQFRQRSHDGGPPDRETMEKAQEACEDVRPDFGGRFSAEEQAEMQDRMLAFADCMREHDIDFPDPDFSGGGVRMGPPEGVDPGDPKFQEATEVCQDEVGMGPGIRGGGGE